MRYGRAIFEVFSEDAALELMLEDIDAARDLFKEAPEFLRFLSDLYIKKESRMLVVTTIFKKAGVSDFMTRAFSVMIERDRHKSIFQAITYAKKLAMERLGLAVADLTLAKEVHLEKIKGEIEKRMSDALDLKVECKLQIDPEIIGGFIIKHGDVIYDASIKGMLENMKKTMFS
jgi:F-type H+-transporting ATPase subunit delta